MRKYVLGALAVCLVTSVARAQANDILVVDAAKAVESCDEHAALVAAVKKQADQAQKHYSGQVKSLQERQKALMETKLSLRDGKWYADVKAALAEEGRLKAVEANIKIELSDKIARGMQKLMISARMAASKIMRARGAKLVLVSKMGKIRLDTENDFKDELINRRVLVSARDLDITEEVIAEMNKAYKARKKAAGAGDEKEPTKKEPTKKEVGNKKEKK